MHNRKLKFSLLLAAGIGYTSLFGSITANAQKPNRPVPVLGESMFRLVEDAVESQAVKLIFDANDAVVKVISGTCVGCERRVFLPASNLRVKVGGEAVKPTPALNGWPATVIYRIDSEEVTSVNFFGRDSGGAL